MAYPVYRAHFQPPERPPGSALRGRHETALKAEGLLPHDSGSSSSASGTRSTRSDCHSPWRRRQLHDLSVQVPRCRPGKNVESACHALSIDDDAAFSPVLWKETRRTRRGSSRCGSRACTRTSAAAIRSKACRSSRWTGCSNAEHPASFRTLRLDAGSRVFRAHARSTTSSTIRGRRGVFYRWGPATSSALQANGIRRGSISACRAHRARHRRLRTRQHSRMRGRRHAAAQLGERGAGRTPCGGGAAGARHDSRGTLLARVRREMAAGRLSYYIYIVTCLVFLNAAWRTAQQSLAQPEGAAGVLASLTSPSKSASGPSPRKSGHNRGCLAGCCSASRWRMR